MEGLYDIYATLRYVTPEMTSSVLLRIQYTSGTYILYVDRQGNSIARASLFIGTPDTNKTRLFDKTVVGFRFDPTAHQQQQQQ